MLVVGSRNSSNSVRLVEVALDVGAEASHLEALGVEIIQPPTSMSWGLVELWVRDPQGNELRLVQVPADHPLRRRVD